jgi:7-carboxy-7-deazaguanine synthase
MYRVTESFLTLQGEGFHAGRKAVFLRLSGCNLWNGLEQGRAAGKADCAKWCDTWFLGKLRMSAEDILQRVNGLWPHDGSQRFVVITGGEPLLQLDQPLIDVLKDDGWEVAVETNGTVEPKFNLDHVWVCCSPKKGSTLAIGSADELKVVVPGGWSEEDILDLARKVASSEKWVQPADLQSPEANRQSKDIAIAFVLKHPGWRVSVQGHKVLGVG